jgi:hypothetical protein
MIAMLVGVKSQTAIDNDATRTLNVMRHHVPVVKRRFEMANQGDEKKPAEQIEPAQPASETEESLDSLGQKLTDTQRERLRAALKELTRGVGEGGALTATMEKHSSHSDNDGWF